MFGSQVRTHGSVEDLIRSTLGGRFIESTPPQAPDSVNLPNQNLQPDEFGKMQIPSLDEVSEIDRSINPPMENKPKSPPVCKECRNLVAECVCGVEEEEVENGDFTFEDPSENYIDFISPEEVEDDEEEDLTPFQRVLKSGVYKKPEPQSSPKRKEQPVSSERFQNSDGIGVRKKERVPVTPISKYYTFYRDRDEVFECKVTIEGTISTANVRLILNTDNWNIVFYGKIKRDGTCVIPIKRLSLFPHGTTGNASLEVIVDDVVFSAWENAFRVEESKKVKVQIKGKS
jgi:hypothetical protein